MLGHENVSFDLSYTIYRVRNHLGAGSQRGQQQKNWQKLRILWMEILVLKNSAGLANQIDFENIQKKNAFSRSTGPRDSEPDTCVSG